jgi:lysophospholipase L1-like esterase
MKHPNRYWQLSRLLFSVLIVLAIISGLSSKYSSLGRMDYFSEIKTREIAPQLEDIKSKIDNNLAQQSPGDTLPRETNHHLDLFFDALENMRDSGGTVHIAYFGDSQIEGDLLTADLRSSLQKKWGGNGVGWMPITSIVAGFRTTIGHSFNDQWNVTDVLSKGKRSFPLGPTGQLFQANPGSSVKFWSKYGHYKRIQLIGHPKTQGDWELSFNSTTIPFHWPDTLQPKYYIDFGKVKTNNISLEAKSGNAILYGMNLENGDGVYVDNFSFRGNSGTSLSQLDIEMMQALDSIIPYRLIVVHYGLNVIGHDVTDYSNYQKSMERTIQHLKKCFPNASILLMGMTDKGYKDNGQWSSDPTVLYLLHTQMEMAKKQDLAFFSLYHAMGGDGSIVSWVQDSIPKLANADYTHMNHRGARVLAKFIDDYLNRSYIEYKKQKNASNP